MSKDEDDASLDNIMDTTVQIHGGEVALKAGGYGKSIETSSRQK